MTNERGPEPVFRRLEKANLTVSKLAELASEGSD